MVGNANQKMSENEQLEKLLKKAKVPTLPIVAQKLVELCEDDNANFAQFARVIETDPGMASCLLRVANSAYYGLRNKATTLQRAITVLGIKYVQSISLGFHLASTLNKFESSGFDMGEFWRQSVFRAVLARQLASHYCPDRGEEAFLIGLLQDSGIPFLVQAIGDQYASLWHETHNSQASLFQMEGELFEFDHLAAAAAINHEWALPDLLAKPICSHHHRGSSDPVKDELDQLKQISYFIGTLSLNNPGSLTDEDITLSNYAQSVFGLDNKSLRGVLKKTKDEFTSVSQLFSEILPDKVDVAELLSQANDLLADLAHDANRKMFDVQSEVEHFKTQCDDLAGSVDYYRKRSETDQLTGLLTRDVLIKYLEEACEKVSTSQSTLMVLFIDLDNFSEVNTVYGHAGGDRLLVEFSKLLQSLFGKLGCVTRHGGDEFVVGLMGLQLKQAVQLSNGFLERLRSFSIHSDMEVPGQEFKFSCSVGMTFYEAGSAPAGPAGILKQSDNLMYQIKNNGKDGLSYEVCPKDEKIPQPVS